MNEQTYVGGFETDAPRVEGDTLADEYNGLHGRVVFALVLTEFLMSSCLPH